MTSEIQIEISIKFYKANFQWDLFFKKMIPTSFKYCLFVLYYTIKNLIHVSE